MKKILVFSILLLSAIAITVGTTITTIQIQPAYSQPSHCFSLGSDQFSRCVTPGKDPSITDCDAIGCLDPIPIDPQLAGRNIGSCHQGSAQGFGECTVTKTLPSPLPPPE
jgi:hypothetical protein